MAQTKKKAPVKKAPVKKAPAKKKAKVAVAKKPASKLAQTDLDFEAILDDDDATGLQPVTGPRDYVLRTRAGKFLHEVSDLVVANQLARSLGIRVKVFKRTPDGEVLMSYSGPGKWD